MNGDFVLATALFYIVTLISGLTLFWIGYLLFSRGVVEPRQVVTPPTVPAGTPPPPATASGEYGGVKLKIENIAPGTVCFILGAILVGIGLFRGPQEVSTSVKEAVKQSEARRDTELAVAMIDRSRMSASQPQFTFKEAIMRPDPLSGESLKRKQERLQKELQTVNTLLEPVMHL
jgi:hypothetical protein